MVSTRTTTDRLIERYNTFTRRPTVQDQRVKALVFKSFERVLGSWLPADRSARLLDVACGEGSLLAFLRHAGYSDLHGLDLSPENVALCHDLGLSFVRKFDAFRLDELPDDQRFDVIFAMDILEHVPKEAASSFLEQMRDRLLPRGYLVIQTPNMGSIMGCFHRYNDLSHEFSLTEKSVVDLLMISGFRVDDIQIRPSWNAATPLGYAREIYLRLLHRLVFLAEDASRPRIATKNLLVRASRG